jgi:hypothetical protein
MTAETTGGDGGAAPPTDAPSLDLEEPVEPASMSLDVVFDILSNSRRRLILAHLDEVGGESTTSDLAEHIAAIENDKPQSELTSQERKRVYVGIYQTHLPKMDDVAVVDVDDRGTVTLGRNADAVYQYLASDDDDAGRSWPAYYGAYTGLSAVALLGTWLLAQSLVPPLFALSLLGSAAIVALHARSSQAA